MINVMYVLYEFIYICMKKVIYISLLQKLHMKTLMLS